MKQAVQPIILRLLLRLSFLRMVCLADPIEFLSFTSHLGHHLTLSDVEKHIITGSDVHLLVTCCDQYLFVS